VDITQYDENTQFEVTVPEKISDWVNLIIELTAVIMWLYGTAGAGKSAMARAMAELLESREQLLATFFFSRSDPSRNHIKSIIATLAYNITLSVPDSRPLIAATIERDPHIFHRPFVCQLKKLVFEPLQQLSLQGVSCPTVVIIDGLDECLNHDERKILLRAISIATAQYSAPLKFVITSRPEVSIARIFNATPVNEVCTQHSLDNEPDSIRDMPYFTISTNCSRSVTCDLRCSLGQVFIADKVVQIWQLFQRAGEDSGVLDCFGRNCGRDL